MSKNAPAIAQELKRLLIECSPLIEEYTSRVCPDCAEVCCKQRHGAFTEADRAYLAVLGEEVPSHDPSWPLDNACQFLGRTGCTKPRWQRAWRCTWFFCGPLLLELSTGPQKQARALTAALEQIMACYDQLKGAKQ
ncbi:MAG: hypothetical protein OEW15_14260 [Nitrospirota bacterium]|nr:hypothetical protein [Nitrospirota bacterium]